MRQKTGRSLALGALLLFGEIGVRGSDKSDTGITILVYDYVGLDGETVRRAEGEVDRIFRRAGVEIAWQYCHSAATPSGTECPDVGPLTPALRLVSRFRSGGGVRAETMGYSAGYMATVSWDETETARSGAGSVSQTLGLIIAHELGHVLLGKAHSVIGIMRARWGLNEWRLAGEDQLAFLPWQAAALRKELRTRSQTVVAVRNTR